MALRTTRRPPTDTDRSNDQTVSRTATPQVPERMGRFFRSIPAYAYFGAALNLAAWISSWARIGPWAYTFFALWLGFILVLDGLNVAVTGSSPLRRGRALFVLMFGVSSVFWWVFEGLNVPVQNWHYVFDHPYSPLAYFLIASLNFSTVLPAVMEIASLYTSIPALRPRLGPAAHQDVPRARPRTIALLLALGTVMLVLPFLMPQVFYGLVWLCLVFLLDPINHLFGRKSALAHLLARDWRFLVALPLSAVTCGFFWEMWNSLALPKWYYTIPFADRFPHLFEMPLPGYLGYLPFALELFAMYQLALLVLRIRDDNLTF
ncbi:MAG TPA: hypothetical protein VF116_15930 [Ktedonobacterales bacterium]